jgi:acyl carrier protein
MISVFEIDSSEINHESSPDSIDKWDSLRHMNLVVALEEEFNIEFEVEEISELMNFKLICEVISKKLI